MIVFLGTHAFEQLLLVDAEGEDRMTHDDLPKLFLSVSITAGHISMLQDDSGNLSSCCCFFLLLILLRMLHIFFSFSPEASDFSKPLHKDWTGIAAEVSHLAIGSLTRPQRESCLLITLF